MYRRVQRLLQDALHMSTLYGPSKIAWQAHWLITEIMNRIPYLRIHYQRMLSEELYKLAEIAANRNFSVRVLDSGWATQRCFTDKYYRTVTGELVEICEKVGAYLGDIPMALHWSRRYEYPYVIMNCMSSIHPSKKFKILDCGCGISPIQFYLAMKQHEIYSLDLNQYALGRVTRFKSKWRLKLLHPTYGNALNLPFPNAFFDRVLCVSVLEHTVRHLRQATRIIFKGVVSELLRVLKPDGLVVISFDVNMNPQKSDHRLYFHEYESLCAMLGILPTSPPQKRLRSSDTEEGRRMGEDLCTFCATFTSDSIVSTHPSQ